MDKSDLLKSLEKLYDEKLSTEEQLRFLENRTKNMYSYIYIKEDIINSSIVYAEREADVPYKILMREPSMTIDFLMWVEEEDKNKQYKK